jgi:ketosteroid isomerase-like protein
MNVQRKSMLATTAVLTLGLLVGSFATYFVVQNALSKANQEDLMLYANTDLSQTAAQWEQAIDGRNGDQIASFFAEDVWAMYPQPLPTLGRDANREAWTAVFQAADFVHPITIDEVVESEQGDLGYTFGRWWAIQPSTGQHVGGRFVAIWQPINGNWQITYLSANAHNDISSEEPNAQ